MTISNFTKPELDYFRDNCNFVNLESDVFEMRASGYTLEYIAEQLHIAGGLTFYMARHTWATVARNQHVPISVISAGMGHTSEQTTRIYLASIDNHLIDDANRMLTERIG